MFQEEVVVFTVTLFSQNGKSIYKNLSELNRDTFNEFVPPEKNLNATIKLLNNKGIHIEAFSEVGITGSCNKELFEKIFNTKVNKTKVRGIQEGEYFTYETVDEISIPKEFCYVEKITMPRQMFVLNEEIRPELPYFHYTVPDGVQKIAKKKLIDSLDRDRKSCNVCIVDTGLYKHNHFLKHNYDISVESAVSFFDPEKDERGHGTGMTAVLLSNIEKSRVTMIKASNLNWSYPVAALQKASKYNFDVLNCSWGIMGFEPQAYLEIANIIRKGTIVIFSCGNGSTDRKKSFLQTIAYPEILSVGGCMVNEDGSIEVSDISSSYDSDIFPNRHAPDLCGICGKLPYAQVILMPIQPAALFDYENGKRDGTKQDDGWFVSSGTSAAAAYVSGLVANIIETNLIDREEIVQVLKKACKTVNSGQNFMGEIPTGKKTDSATGGGFLDFESILNYMGYSF